MALAAEGYANKMRGASLINIKENGHILIGDKAPELRNCFGGYAKSCGYSDRGEYY